jgi:hypothetical protein
MTLSVFLPMSRPGQLFTVTIVESARANMSWRASLPVEQQIQLQNVPTVSHPEDTPTVKDAPEGESSNGGGDANAGI